jgi:two-component system chemotaxis response regulator CheB
MTADSPEKSPPRILVAEDDPGAALLMVTILRRDGYRVVSVRDGQEAIERLRRERFQALVTDWLMPRMDGIELILRARKEITPPPLMFVVTSMDSFEAQKKALRSGADDFIGKPYAPDELLKTIRQGFQRKGQSFLKPTSPSIHRREAPPPFVGVVVTAGSGGPEAVDTVFRALPAHVLERAAFFLSIPGPSWMLSTFADQLKTGLGLDLATASDGGEISPGRVYVAPSGRHLLIEGSRKRLRLRLSRGPLENFVRPSADPLLRSGARVFGAHGIAVVMTGLGCDGTLGCAHLAAAGGRVLIQDPSTAVAGQMAESVWKAGLTKQKSSLLELPGHLGLAIAERDVHLKALAHLRRTAY